MPCVSKDEPTKVARHAGRAGRPKIEPLKSFPAKNEQGGQDEKKNGKAESKRRRRPFFAQADGADPKRAARDQNKHTGAGKIENDGRDQERKREQPSNPAFAAVAHVILAASEGHD